MDLQECIPADLSDKKQQIYVLRSYVRTGTETCELRSFTFHLNVLHLNNRRIKVAANKIKFLQVMRRCPCVFHESQTTKPGLKRTLFTLT